MTSRKPTDLCFLCNEKEATQTNSHIIPAALLKSMIGKRDREHSFLIDTSKVVTDEYFGRNRLDNPSTEVKEHHHARDYYFCPECERKLGALESKTTPHLTEQFRNPKFSGNYRTFNSGDLTWKELLKINSDDFNVLFLSVVWRKALQQQIDDNQPTFAPDDIETIRGIIHSYLSGDAETYKDLCGRYAMMILTAKSVSDSSANLIAAPNWFQKPNLFLINDFTVLVYTEKDLIEGMNKPESFFQFPPDSRFLNISGSVPKIIVLPQDFWDNMTKRWLGDVAEIYANRLIQKIGSPTKTTKKKKKTRKMKRKKSGAMRARRALKSKKRKR